MTQLYDLLDSIKNELISNPNVNTVSFGDITEVDLDKTTIYPLAHLIIDNAVIKEHTISFTLKVLCADIVDYSKEDKKDSFYKNNNLQDVLNTQLNVLNILISKLRRGNLYKQLLQVETDIILKPFQEKFENELAGFSADIIIEIKNNNISIC